MRISFRQLAIVLCVLCISGAAARAENVFRLTGGTVESGENILSQVLFDIDTEVIAWSVGVCYDDADLMIVEAVLGETALNSNFPDPPGFFGIATDPVNGPGITLGFVVDIMSPDGLDAGTGYEIMDLTFLAIAPALEPIDTVVSFCDTLGDPPIENTLLAGELGIIPDLVDATITILPPPDFCIDLVCTGGLTDATIEWDVCEPFDIFLFYRDGELLGLLDPEVHSYFDPELEPGTYYYSVIGIAFPDPTEAPVLVSSECVVEVIPLILTDFTPKQGHYGGGTLVTVTGLGFEGGKGLTVEFGGIAATDITVLDDGTLTCLTPPSEFLGPVSVFIANDLGEDTADDTFLYGFIRGDFTGDGSASIADGLAGLEYLFVGGAASSCPDAADVNDDALLDIADPLKLLRYLFSAQLPPEAPFPEAGLDPTTNDAFGCIGGP